MRMAFQFSLTNQYSRRKLLPLDSRWCCCLVAKSCHQLFFDPHGLQPTRPLCPWDSPGKNIGAGCHFLLQGIFPNQRSNTVLPHCRQTLPTEPPGNCSANRFISTIFLDSIYMHQYTTVFSFWLTSLCIVGSRFIYLIRTDLNVFLFMAE